MPRSMTPNLPDGTPGVDKGTSKIKNPKHPRYQTLQGRLESFVSWPGRYVPKTPEELSEAGFFYIGSADRVTCFQCGITLRDWEEEHDPVTEHRRYSGNCKFINTLDRVGKEQTRDVSGRHSQSKSLKHPQYYCIKTRLETFSKWPEQLFPKYLEMSAAGFFYAEEADLVTCYRCGITHGGWKKEHNQTELHLKHARECLRDYKSPPQQIHIDEREPGEGLNVSHSHMFTGSDSFDTTGSSPGPAAALSRKGDQMIETEEAIDSVGSDELFGDGQSKNTGQEPLSPEYREDMITGNTSNDVMLNTANFAQFTASLDVKPDSSDDKVSGSFRNKVSGSFRNMMSGALRNMMSVASNDEMSEEPKDALQGNPKQALLTPEAPDIMAAKAHDDESEAPGAIAAEPKGDESEVPDYLLSGMKNKFMKYMACIGLDKE